MILTPAEKILYDLGVTEPAEIDLEAIAWTRNARVRYRPLCGCEARIFGNDDRAIISVNSNSPPQRMRFSLAHEIGHWEHHRGKLLFCRKNDIAEGPASSIFERVANNFASDLLMPAYLFNEAIRERRRADFQTVDHIADLFDVSRAASAIRVAAKSPFPSIVICHNRQGRHWFARSPLVPDRWFPKQQLDPRSLAFDVQFGANLGMKVPRKVPAAAWFELREAERYDLIEQTVRSHNGETLTMLEIVDSGMLADR